MVLSIEPACLRFGRKRMDAAEERTAKEPKSKNIVSKCAIDERE